MAEDKETERDGTETTGEESTPDKDAEQTADGGDTTSEASSVKSETSQG